MNQSLRTTRDQLVGSLADQTRDPVGKALDQLNRSLQPACASWSVAEADGEVCRYRNVAFAANPYPEGTTFYYAWKSGWGMADDDIYGRGERHDAARGEAG